MNKPIKKGNPDKQSLASMRQSSYQGPLPLPQHLEEYDRIVPGAAERIIKMAEIEQKHRLEKENLALKVDAENISRYIKDDSMLKKTSLFLTVLLVIPMFLATAVFLAYLGYEKAAMVVGGGTLIAVTSIVITRKIKGSSDSDKNIRQEQ